ncbi:flagellar L-ring protein [Aureimonas sp. SA4125]|uniref:flagellar basal body L-ring protein FlgH n=1 Tax=Aureimonas sp. SA4125 TaxID=2826993 RepID=UPI001CC5E1F0|nr:flagellar basal body L-ring protein FlgH [Aureimonas sp. SA4125]BDA85937.1 flagellar L-ring protein [Aureimonas sp. SA4125]
MTLVKMTSVLALLILGGCSTARQDFLVEPRLSAPGTGVNAYPTLINPAQFPAERLRGQRNSLWVDKDSNLFRDARALNNGDIVTVKIEIKDGAEIDNNSKRSRDASTDAGVDFDGTLDATSLGTLGASLGINNKTTTTGKGNVKRSEKIDLSVAAVVTQVLPNGNLYITGQQEIRVNFEVRVLTIAGIIRPGDILPGNTIPYDRIAEARISYGGRGRLTEVQQPAWGQQIVDQVLPY